MAKRDPAEEERFRQDIKSALERPRAAITSKVHPREQSHFLGVIDRIQEFVTTKAGELDQIQGQIQKTKDDTRRHLRTRPSDMVQVLNELDGIEQDVIDFFTKALSGGK
jgi:hypothetical protein